MRASALALGSALVLSGCATATSVEPTVVYRTKKVLVEVPVACPVNVPTVEGPDRAPADSTILYAAIYAEARIRALREAEQALRRAIEACNAGKDTPQRPSEARQASSDGNPG